MKTKTTFMALAMFAWLAATTAYSQNCYPDRNTGQLSKATPVLALFNDKLHMLHLGESSNEIWYSSLEGDTWTPNVQIGQQSKVTPVLAVLNDRLHMLHLGNTSNDIWYSNFDGNGWTPNVRIGQRSKAAPVMAVFGGRLHMLHLGDTSNEIWYSSFNGNTWTPNVPIGQQSKVTPVLAVFNDQLHMLHLGNSSNEIYYSRLEGNTWTPNVRIFQQSKAAPVMAVFDNKLHMLHLGDTSNEIWYSTFDGNAWTTNVTIGQQSKATPVMAVFNGRLHMLHLGDTSNQIWYSYLNGDTWRKNIPLPDRSSKATPVVASIADTGPGAGLHVVHTGSESEYIFHGIIPPVPNAPSEVSFDNIGKRSVRVSWKDNSTVEEQFDVYRSLHATDDFTHVGTTLVGCPPAGSSEGETYSFEDQGLEPGTEYDYRITAVNYAGPSPFSETASLVTLPPDKPFVSTFTLVDADKDEEIGELKDGDVIDFAALAASRVSIRANTNPAVVGKVEFRLSGPETRTHTEYVAPYLLFANNQQDYFPWTPANGDYTLTVTPYAARDGSGGPGTASTIAFKVINRQTTFRINVFGEAYTTRDGRSFSGDDLKYIEQAHPKFSNEDAVTDAIAGTVDDALYQGQRWGVFGYNFPLPAGNYRVTLHFAEIFFGFREDGGVGSRRFNVDMEGTRKLTDYDVFFEAGGAKRAIQETFAVSVTDGNLDIDFLEGSANWPFISAIEVVPAAGARVATAGTKGPEDWQVRAFPNPAARKLTVTTSVPVRELQETRVMNATGRVYLLNQHTLAGENQLEVNVADLPGGLYLLRLQSRSGHRFVKFIKQ